MVHPALLCVLLMVGIKEAVGACAKETAIWKGAETFGGPYSFDAVPSTCTCSDNKAFVDEQGYACFGWNDNCISGVEEWGMSEEGILSLVQNCPKACNVCTCAPWTGCFKADKHAIVNETKHLRALRSANQTIQTGPGWPLLARYCQDFV